MKVIFVPLRKGLVLRPSSVPAEVGVNLRGSGNKPAKEL
jgi:hypothetical protein